MTGTLTWILDGRFNTAARASIKAGKPIHIVQDTKGVYLRFNRTKGTPITVFAQSAELAASKDKDKTREMLHSICDDEPFKETVPSEYIQRAVEHGCETFSARFTATKIAFESTGTRKGVKPMDGFNAWFKTATLTQLQQMVKVGVDGWDLDEQPPTNWQTFKKDVSRAKLVTWIKEEFGDLDLMRELFAAYDERIAALPEYNRLRATRKLPTVEWF